MGDRHITVGLYTKGILWRRKGYYISIGITDPRFFFGTLAEAKRDALKAFRYEASDVRWLEYSMI